MKGIFVFLAVALGASQAQTPGAYGIRQTMAPVVLRIYPTVDKGQDNAYHNYFNVEFSEIKGSIGYNAYLSYCKQDTCKSQDTVNAAHRRAIPAITAYRISSMDSTACSKNSCFSTGNFLSVGGTYFLKVCSVDENGNEDCSPYKAFVYKGVD